MKTRLCHHSFEKICERFPGRQQEVVDAFAELYKLVRKRKIHAIKGDDGKSITYGYVGKERCKFVFVRSTGKLVTVFPLHSPFPT